MGRVGEGWNWPVVAEMEIIDYIDVKTKKEYPGCLIRSWTSRLSTSSVARAPSRYLMDFLNSLLESEPGYSPVVDLTYRDKESGRRTEEERNMREHSGFRLSLPDNR